MNFNPEFLWITSKQNPIVYQYYIGNSAIEHVSQSNYVLGVTIDESLTWNNHILMIVNKARQINNFLR